MRKIVTAAALAAALFILPGCKQAEEFFRKAGEIVAKVAALEAAVSASGGTTPEVDAAVAELRAVAQALDDLNPDPV